MRGLYLANELFVIPKDSSYILYAPLTGNVLDVTPATIKLLQDISKGMYSGEQEALIDELKEQNIIVTDQQKTPTSHSNVENNSNFRPTSVTLCPTSDCNLRCIYCYSSAGETHMYMDEKIAIDSK